MDFKHVKTDEDEERLEIWLDQHQLKDESNAVLINDLVDIDEYSEIYKEYLSLYYDGIQDMEVTVKNEAGDERTFVLEGDPIAKLEILKEQKKVEMKGKKKKK